MSRGTRITPLRIPPAMLERIDQALAKSNRVRGDQPYNRTSWIMHAIAEKLAKLERSRRATRKPKKAAAPEFDVAPIVDAFIATSGQQ